MDNNIPNVEFTSIGDIFKNIRSDFKSVFSKNEVTAAAPPEKVGKKAGIAALITAIVCAVYYYFMLPVLNFRDGSFYQFIGFAFLIFVVLFWLLCKAHREIESRLYVKKKLAVPVISVLLIAAIVLIGSLSGATIFRAGAYSRLMPVTSSDFDTDFAKISYDTVPRIDEERALTLADQQLGSLSEYKSQYVVSNDTAMINYNGVPVRVAYLEYADFFKWLNNTKNGLPAYMIIDLVSQKVTVVNCVERFGAGIKYSPTEYFNEELIRHLRFQYPTEILDTPNFEIDDDGRPYWITAVMKKTIGLFGGEDVKGVIITDALTGESEYHDIEKIRTDSAFAWIDVVYSENLLLSQYNYYGRLSNGFWNSIIFQNDVNQVSAGAGNIALDNDIWVYTGVTSSKSDFSNFGFILCNQRTKETRYYQNGGAMEQSAMDSAEDAVQNFGYMATFPILLDIEGQPTYFMSLYGDSNTVKGYALVNLDDKTVVGTGLVDNLKSDVKSLNAAVENYIQALKDKGIISGNVDMNDYLVDEDGAGDKPQKPTAEVVKGKVASVMSSVNDGNTVYYLEIDGKYYYISVKDCMDVLLVKAGDEVAVTLGDKADGQFVAVTSVER